VKDFKVLLIYANTTLDTLIPSSIATLSAFIKKEGYQVRVFDTTFYKTRETTGDDARVETLQVKKTDFSELGIFLNKTDIIEDFVKAVKEYKPNLIGLSTVSVTYLLGLQLLKSIADLNIPTIVGGVHASISPEDVIKEDCVDMVCIGEGEGALLDLCNRMYKNENITSIPNLWVKKNGKIFKNSVRPPINIDELPFQDWSIFEERRRYKPMGGKIRITANIELNRGCPYACNFCVNEFLHNLYGGKAYRERNISRFIEEVKHLKEQYNIEYIYMSAETFLSTSKKRFQEFIERYSEIKIPFWMETRPESVTGDKIKQLKDVGCEAINMGIESGDPELRANLLNRKMTDEQVIKAFQTIRKHNIRVGANVIIGFPTETREQIFKTVELCRKSDPNNVMIHIFNPYNGTRLYDLSVEKGYIAPGTIGGDYRSDVVLDMPHITKDEIRGLQRTIAMYVKFPKDFWPEIEKAEKLDAEGNKKFEELSEKYTEEYLK
jgi:anaerobic magnesium-protoporphyrin IX monomethyl ester cyclase